MDFRRCFRLLQSTFHRQKPNRYLRRERNSYRGLNNDISLKQQWKWHHRSSSSRILYATGVVGTASAFSWDDQGISNEEIDELVEEVKLLKLGSHLETEDLPSTQDKNVPSTWEIILDKPRIKIWKVFDEKLGKTIYKVLGRNSEVSADHFYVVQTDLEYRKAWDKLVLEIDIVDEKCEGDQQVLRWTTAFPYPFKPREYVYVRRSEVSRRSCCCCCCMVRCTRADERRRLSAPLPSRIPTSLCSCGSSAWRSTRTSVACSWGGVPCRRSTLFSLSFFASSSASCSFCVFSFCWS